MKSNGNHEKNGSPLDRSAFLEQRPNSPPLTSSMEKVVSDEFNEYNKNHEYYYYYFPTELYTDENNNLLPNKLSGAYSEFESFIKSNNKIPEYAREYKREYQFIRGINKEFKYFLNKQDNLNNGLFESYIADRIKYFMKRFLRAQEKGKLKDISEFEIPDDIVFNLNKIKVLFDCLEITL